MAGDNAAWLGVGLDPSPVMIMDAITRKGISLEDVRALLANCEPQRPLSQDWKTYMLFHAVDGDALLLQWENRRTRAVWRTFRWELRRGPLFEIWAGLPGGAQALMCKVPVFRLNALPTDQPDGLIAPAALIDTVPDRLLIEAHREPEVRERTDLRRRFDRAWEIYLDAFHGGQRLWAEYTDDEISDKHYTPLPNNISSFYNA